MGSHRGPIHAIFGPWQMLGAILGVFWGVFFGAFCALVASWAAAAEGEVGVVVRRDITSLERKT